MFNTQGGYNLADIAAVTGGRDGGFGLGDGNGWWIILLFLFTMGGWGGYGARGGATTREEIAYGFDINGLENGVRGVQQGLCDGFYAMNTGMLNGFGGVQNAMCQGFSGVNAGMGQNTNDIIAAINADTIAGMQNTNAINAGLTALGTQMAQCCCDNRYDMTKGFADLGYALATQACDTRRAIADSTRDIIDNNNAGVRSILDFLTQDKIAALTAENQNLKFAASQSAQNAYLVNALKEPCAVPAYIVPNPNSCGYGLGRVTTPCGTDFII
jgi:hypothetical protein